MKATLNTEPRAGIIRWRKRIVNVGGCIHRVKDLRPALVQSITTQLWLLSILQELDKTRVSVINHWSIWNFPFLEGNFRHPPCMWRLVCYHFEGIADRRDLLIILSHLWFNERCLVWGRDAWNMTMKFRFLRRDLIINYYLGKIVRLLRARKWLELAILNFSSKWFILLRSSAAWKFPLESFIFPQKSLINRGRIVLSTTILEVLKVSFYSFKGRSLNWVCIWVFKNKLRLEALIFFWDLITLWWLKVEGLNWSAK